MENRIVKNVLNALMIFGFLAAISFEQIVPIASKIGCACMLIGVSGHLATSISPIAKNVATVLAIKFKDK